MYYFGVIRKVSSSYPLWNCSFPCKVSFSYQIFRFSSRSGIESQYGDQRQDMFFIVFTKEIQRASDSSKNSKDGAAAEVPDWDSFKIFPPKTHLCLHPRDLV
jgi:hypothetical protein